MPSPLPSLAEQTCIRGKDGTPAIVDQERYEQICDQLPGWEIQKNELVKTFTLKNDIHALSFMQAVGWIAHQQDHHPELRWVYKTCEIRYTTHSLKSEGTSGALSENDLICAARIEALQH